VASKSAKRGTALLYELIAEARRHPDAIVLGRGDPDFETPPHVIVAARQAMAEHASDAVPPEGILPLRQAIAERVMHVNGIEVNPETEVVVTNGGQEALFLTILATIGVDDELLIPEPNYNTYRDAVRFARGIAVSVPTLLEEDYRVIAERVRAAITPRSRAVLLTSPNNPAASVIAPDDVRAVLRVAQEHDLLIVADDIYDLFIFDEHRHLSPASLPGGKERTLTINALSKSLAMTGWRLGWIVGPADLMAQVRQCKAAVSGGCSIFSQYAGLAALTGSEDALADMRAAYVRRRRIVLEAMDDMKLRYGASQGGQFIFVDVSDIGIDGDELARRILDQAHVLVYPGSAFAEDADNYLRLTFLQPEDQLQQGLERMKRVLSEVTTTAHS
jgi:aspartate/methionine/tyrosine aminotransferase